jgi:hypothetical protein
MGDFTQPLNGHNYLPSCQTKGFPATAEFKLSVNALMQFAKKRKQQLVNLPVTDAPWCISCNVKTLGLQHLQLLDMAVRSELPDQAYKVHHMMDEVLIKQHAI